MHLSGARSDFKSSPWGQGVCQRQALKTSLLGKSCWYLRDLDVPPPLEICLQTSYLEFPSLFCCQSAAKTNAPVHCQVKVIFLASWSSKEEFWLCQLCMSSAMGLIPAFFCRHQVTRLKPDSKKEPPVLSHEQQDMQLNPLTCPESDLSPHKHSGKGFSGKSKPR